MVRAWLFPDLGLPYGSKPTAEMRVVGLAGGAEPKPSGSAAWLPAPV